MDLKSETAVEIFHKIIIALVEKAAIGSVKKSLTKETNATIIKTNGGY